MIDFPSLVVPSFDVFHSDLHSHYNEEAVLAQEEADYEEKLNEIRTANSNLIPIGKTTPENDQEEYEPDAEDEEGDNAEEEGEDWIKKVLWWIEVWTVPKIEPQLERDKKIANACATYVYLEKN